MKSYGSIIHEARRAKALTLEGLATKVGTHKGYISGIETGSVNPPSTTLSTKLAKVLGLDPKDLLRRSLVEMAPKAIQAEIATLLFPGEHD